MGVRSGVISRVTIVITHIRGLVTPFIATHEPPNSLMIEIPVLRRDQAVEEEEEEEEGEASDDASPYSAPVAQTVGLGVSGLEGLP